MTEEPGPLYLERGGSWWGALFPVGFAALGIGVEALSGPVFWWLWILTAAVLVPFTLLWVYARRRFLRVRLTSVELTQGTETLPVENIAEVSDGLAGDEEPLGVRVLGGGHTVPRKFQPVRLRLTDDTRVLAWARDGDALRTALRGVVEA